MKKLMLLMCLFSVSAFANWQTEVALGIDGQTWKIENAKIEEGKEVTIALGNYILKMTIKKSTQEAGLDVLYTVNEKKGEKLILVNKGDDILEIGQKMNEIFAKGETGQPNSMITLKMKKI
jgi:pyridoxine 5'-phosphate synthase PdxJ